MTAKSGTTPTSTDAKPEVIAPKPPPTTLQIETKDKWQVLGLIASGFSPTNIYQNPKADRLELLWCFPDDAKDVYEKIMRGEPLMLNLHDLVSAEIIFKQNLTRFRQLR
jgi:hypothetical protein